MLLCVNLYPIAEVCQSRNVVTFLSHAWSWLAQLRCVEDAVRKLFYCLSQVCKLLPRPTLWDLDDSSACFNSRGAFLLLGRAGMEQLWLSPSPSILPFPSKRPVLCRICFLLFPVSAPLLVCFDRRMKSFFLCEIGSHSVVQPGPELTV